MPLLNNAPKKSDSSTAAVLDHFPGKGTCILDLTPEVETGPGFFARLG